MPITTVVFDMDDTLVASMGVWHRAEKRLFELLGTPFSEELMGNFKGWSVLDTGRGIHAAIQPDGLSADECGALLRKFLIEEFESDFEPMPGADVAVRRLAGEFDMAVASGSPHHV